MSSGENSLSPWGVYIWEKERYQITIDCNAKCGQMFCRRKVKGSASTNGGLDTPG